MNFHIFEENRSDPPSARFFIIMIRHGEIKMVSDRTEITEGQLVWNDNSSSKKI